MRMSIVLRRQGLLAAFRMASPCRPPDPVLPRRSLLPPILVSAANPNQVQKKKMWEEVQPLLKTSSDRVANYKGRTMMTSGGAITAPTLADGNIS